MIKYPGPLDAQLKKEVAPIYILMGQDTFLLSQCRDALKIAFQKKETGEIDKKRFYPEDASGWDTVIQTANAYTLFHEASILDITWSKKTLDAKSKTYLKAYAENPNPHSLIIISAKDLTAKQCTAFNKHKNIVQVTMSTLNAGAQIQWIKQQLQQYPFKYTEDIPKRIQTCTAGNLEAAHQTIERLKLVHEPNTMLDSSAVQEQLVDEREYKLYEISGACLMGDTPKALDLVRRAAKDNVEPTLLLWTITQELRILEQLKAGTSFQALNIFSFKVPQYQKAERRLTRGVIYGLIQQSQLLDAQIKSGNSQQTWQATEQLVLAFSR